MEKSKVLVIDTKKASEEILDILVKHRVTMAHLDEVLALVRNYANTSTLIQNTSFFKDED